MSDGNLVREVAARLARQGGSPKSPAPIVELDPGVDIALRPFDMLLELGTATVPPLPDPMRLASRWALLRYGWALGSSSPGRFQPLRLSSYGERLRHHHRTLMSEEL